MNIQSTITRICISNNITKLNSLYIIKINIKNMKKMLLKFYKIFIKKTLVMNLQQKVKRYWNSQRNLNFRLKTSI